MDLLRELLGKSGMAEINELANAYDISKAKNDIEHLNKRLESYDGTRNFEAGDIIEWKPGLKSSKYKFPAYGQPVYCYEIDSMHELGREVGESIDCSDLVFAIYHEEIDAIGFFRGDSRRFRKYRAPSE